MSSTENTERSCMNCKNRHTDINANPCKGCKPGIRNNWSRGTDLYKPALAIGVEE